LDSDFEAGRNDDIVQRYIAEEKCGSEYHLSSKDGDEIDCSAADRKEFCDKIGMDGSQAPSDGDDRHRTKHNSDVDCSNMDCEKKSHVNDALRHSLVSGATTYVPHKGMVAVNARLATLVMG
jgi:hypothetical protein